MSKLFLDLSKMTKIKDTKDGTHIFQHKDGHQIHVNSKALTPKMRADLEALALKAKGGKILRQANPKLEESKKEPPHYDNGGDVSQPKPVPSSEPTPDLDYTKNSTPFGDPVKNLKKGLGMAAGGGVSNMPMKLMAKGGPSQDPTQRHLLPGDKIPNAIEKQVVNQAGRRMYADGSDDVSSADTPDQIVQDAANAAPQQSNTVPAPTDQQGAAYAQAYPETLQKPALMQIPDEPQGAAYAQAYNNSIAASPAVAAQQQDDGSAGPAQLPQPPKNPDKVAANLATDPAAGMISGYQEQLQGIQKEAAAKGNLGQQQAAVLEQQNQARIADEAPLRQHAQQIMDESDALTQDLKNGHIDPNQYWADKSVPGKISTAIGLILGGIGGGLTHQENPALKFLNAQIDRNINAQQSQMDRQRNVLAAYNNQFNNINQARDMLRINHLDATKNMMETAAAKNATPMAAAQAQQAIGQIDQQKNMTVAKWAAMNTINGGNATEGNTNAAIQTLRWADPEKAKEMESRTLPGVGVSSVPLDTEARNKIQATQDFQAKMANLYNWAAQHSGEVKVINPQDVVYGKSLAQAAQNSYRTAQQMGVYKQSEAPLLEGEVPADPTAFLNKYRVLPAYKAVLDNNQLKMNTLKSSYGVKPFAQPQQATNNQITGWKPSANSKPRQ